MVQISAAEELLLNHNLETYIMKRLPEKLLFNKILRSVNNTTYEFSSVIAGKTAREEIDEKIMSEPNQQTEDADWNDITISPLYEQKGNFIKQGYRIKYTDDMLMRNNALQTLEIFLNKAIAGIAIKYNATVLKGLVEGSGQELPTGLTTWNDNDTDIPGDIRKIKNSFKRNSGFKLGRLWLSWDAYDQVDDYFTSFDTTNKSLGDTIDVRGVLVKNAENSFDIFKDTALETVNVYGMSDEIEQAIIENAVNPKYSVFAAAKATNPKLNIPDGLINIKPFEDPYKADVYGKSIWFTVGVNNREPDVGIQGTIEIA